MIELSEKCPECGNRNIKILDSHYLYIPSKDILLPPEYDIIWLKEHCPECGFCQEKSKYGPDPDEKHDTRYERI